MMMISLPLFPIQTLVFSKFFYVPLGVGLLATKSEGVGLIVSAISFQDLHSMWSQSNRVTDAQTHRVTDRRHAMSISRFALQCIAW